MAHFKRASGVLLHPTALPGPHGIGTLGRQCHAFLHWLKSAGQNYWQICPLVPTGYGDSPYQGLSAFAGNPNLIDLDNLVSLKLLSQEDLLPFLDFPDEHVDYSRLIPAKLEALHQAWRAYSSGMGPKSMQADYDDFLNRSSTWLKDFSLFMVLKERHGFRPWNEWDEDLRFRDPYALKNIADSSQDEIGFHSFVQYLFYRQWNALKTAAAEKQIRIIGDLPIFIAYDSSDCWAHPELFQLDEKRLPTHVAGVPPDYFSTTGQLWGNPLYDWEAMEGQGFQWWISILENKLKYFDVLRIDHFRGFSAYWSVPFGETTAINGRWISSPGSALFAKIKDSLGDLPIIAEDLGVITDDVVNLIREFDFPGMKVLQFAFDSSEENSYLPHNYSSHCIVYTGTHDNDTSAGWFEKAPEKVRQTAGDYMNLPAEATGFQAAEAMLRTAMESIADLAITPVQDVLGFGSQARFNTPGSLGGNWTWRLPPGALDDSQAQRLRDFTRIYGRMPDSVS